MVQQDIDNDCYFYRFVHFYRNIDNTFLHASPSIVSGLPLPNGSPPQRYPRARATSSRNRARRRARRWTTRHAAQDACQIVQVTAARRCPQRRPHGCTTPSVTAAKGRNASPLASIAQAMRAFLAAIATSALP